MTSGDKLIHMEGGGFSSTLDPSHELFKGQKWHLRLCLETNLANLAKFPDKLGNSVASGTMANCDYLIVVYKKCSLIWLTRSQQTLNSYKDMFTRILFETTIQRIAQSQSYIIHQRYVISADAGATSGTPASALRFTGQH